MKKSQITNQAFTLVEVMIVVAVIGVLAAIAVPSFIKAREQTHAKSCQENIRIIYGAQQQWAVETKKGGSEVPTESNLTPYISGGVFPTCPAGGTYTLKKVDELPTCATHQTATGPGTGHVIPL